MGKIAYKIQKKLFRSSTNDINYNTMKKLLNDNPNGHLIDVRNRDEYTYKHLDNAINIPMHEVTSRIGNVVRNKSDLIIVYCEYGGRSQKVLNKLQKLGYTNVYNLDGGIEAI